MGSDIEEQSRDQAKIDLNNGEALPFTPTFYSLPDRLGRTSLFVVYGKNYQVYFYRPSSQAYISAYTIPVNGQTIHYERSLRISDLQNQQPSPNDATRPFAPFRLPHRLQVRGDVRRHSVVADSPFYRRHEARNSLKQTSSHHDYCT